MFLQTLMLKTQSLQHWMGRSLISFLNGVVHSTNGPEVTLDVRGVGYQVHCTQQCLSQLTTGESATIVIHTEMREASIALYGFIDQTEKQVFSLLTRVKGVGARSASDILSSIDSQDLLRSIGTSDVTRLQTLKGIGKKTAERIVVELRDKVAEFVSGAGLASSIERLEDTPMQEAQEALIALGFAKRDAEQAIAKIDFNAMRKPDSGEIVREALRFI